jgi:hypothetical protein
MPIGLSVSIPSLGETHKLPGEGREVLGILIGTDLFGFGSRQFVPLLTGNLTSSAGRA